MTIATASAASVDYVLGSSHAEHHRLLRQSRLLAGITRHWIEDLGLRPGMRILDVGSGVGDIALLLAGIVGPKGEIVGIDFDQAALAVAARRVSERGLDHVSFRVASLYVFPADRPFDAVIGRSVLIHQPNPGLALECLTRHLRPGGIVAFQEPWFSQSICHPKIPLWDDLMGWMTKTFKAAGLDADLGARLPAIFDEAGLFRPQLCFENRLECSADGEIFELAADTVRNLLPTM